MPYKIEVEHYKLPKELDRRIKLTITDKEEIKKLIKKGLSNSEIAKIYGVHRKTIYNIRNPDKLLKAKEDYKIRRLDGRYYNKDKATKAIRDTRQYRYKNKDLLIKN